MPGLFIKRAADFFQIRLDQREIKICQIRFMINPVIKRDIVGKIIKEGPLHQQLREALQYIQNSIIQEQIIKIPNKAEADRFFNYPYAAIEESLFILSEKFRMNQ